MIWAPIIFGMSRDDYYDFLGSLVTSYEYVVLNTHVQSIYSEVISLMRPWSLLIELKCVLNTVIFVFCGEYPVEKVFYYIYFTWRLRLFFALKINFVNTRYSALESFIEFRNACFFVCSQKSSELLNNSRFNYLFTWSTRRFRSGPVL